MNVLGINRHFQMLIIHDKLNTSVAQRIPIQSIWEHLSTMYDLQALVSYIISTDVFNKENRVKKF